MPLIAITFALLAATTSPFGTLSDENNMNRTILEPSGRTVADYARLLNEYNDLDDSAARAFGAQRTALQEQALGRAKDVLLSKLGAAETHLKNLMQRLGDAGQSLGTELSSFQGYMSEAQQSIEAAETIAELRALSLQINIEIADSFGIGNYYASKLSVQRGLAIIEALMGKADLVQSHIDAAGELGGDISAIQAKFDAAMLSLENAKNSYGNVSAALDGLNSTDRAAVQVQFQRVRELNQAVSIAQSDLKQVVAELRALYGKSPWTI